MYKELIEKAIEARAGSYSPYSDYAVGAALMCGDGSIITAANIENASYGLSMCAERCAFFKAIGEGRNDFKAIAIAGGSVTSGISDYAYPCGACRQVMREFVNPGEFKVIVAVSVDKYEEYTLEELLPRSFGPDNLA